LSEHPVITKRLLECESHGLLLCGTNYGQAERDREQEAAGIDRRCPRVDRKEIGAGRQSSSPGGRRRGREVIGPSPFKVRPTQDLTQGAPADRAQRPNVDAKRLGGPEQRPALDTRWTQRSLPAMAGPVALDAGDGNIVLLSTRSRSTAHRPS
jgi:hypothetical protein